MNKSGNRLRANPRQGHLTTALDPPVNGESRSTLKILVVIASYGVGNDRYLSQLLQEYRSMPFQVDIVVLSNIKKEVGPGAELIVELPKNGWTLPFSHKKIFAQRLNDYDLFIYSEDDTLITEKNLAAFLTVSKVLPENAIVGFIRVERGQNGAVSYPEVHGHFHWESESVQSIGDYHFARFTNEHSACYVITREQLRRAIESGGFLPERWDGKYDLICTAATDPYTQCGFSKMVCISHLEDFLVHHLSDKYTGKDFGVGGPEMQRQVEALLRIGRNGHRPASLFRTETKLRGALYSKGYYEPVRPEIIAAIPAGVRSVLSVGCGWGATEARLAEQGMKVTAVPIDTVIPGGAEAGGVEIVGGTFEIARGKLAGRQFDCLLVSSILHLLEDPTTVLASFAQLLSPGSVAIILVPNLLRFKLTYDVAKKVASYSRVPLPIICMKMRGDKSFERLGDFETTGVHTISRRILRDWSNAAGLRLERTIELLPQRARTASRLTLGLLDRVLASEIIAVAKRT
jgi:2-polyprenyl-3-methyl-5-hydroxy-6-metoxy-1,4-benzoquinol methylase